MCRYRLDLGFACMWAVAISLASAPRLLAADLDRLRGLIESGHADQAIPELVAEVDENPAHEPARILLARALEVAKRRDDAVRAWQTLLLLSSDGSTRRDARRAISRLKRRMLDESGGVDGAARALGADPFRIPMPAVTWAGLEAIEDVNYRPAILPAPYNLSVPPFAHETSHFTVFSTNERLSQIIGERAEIFLDFMAARLFGGRSWAVRFPILVYVDYDDYLFHGGPSGSGGVTLGHVSGRTQAILLYQLRRDRGVWKYGIESVLPHELTHAVINEFFAGRRPPQWLHEAIAGRFEQTRDHYGEAARLGRRVAGGEFFRMRDLFDQKSYPERIELFYEQSAAVVLYLFETGPDAMHAFLSELKAGNGHDAACAAALGIPEHRAVEHFEQRWVAWIKRCYRQRRGQLGDDDGLAQSQRLTTDASQSQPNEMAAVDVIRDWRTLDLSSRTDFFGAEASPDDWRYADAALSSSLPREGATSLLPIRVAESPPLAVRSEVVWRGR